MALFLPYAGSQTGHPCSLSDRQPVWTVRGDDDLEAEIILEGSDDGASWREYSFPYKPGNLQRGLPLAAPYQPRLDWEMWFAALDVPQENSWVQGLIFPLAARRLLGPAAT